MGIAIPRFRRIVSTLNAHRDDALLYKRLATLRTDAPISETLEVLRWRGVPRESFAAFCERVGATSLRTRPRRWTER